MSVQGTYVGGHGSGNSLTIANGATYTNTYSKVAIGGSDGGATTPSDNNSLTVTGAGSLLYFPAYVNGHGLFVGDPSGAQNSSGNSLTVAAGGQVILDTTPSGNHVVVGNDGHNNTITVTGSNSLLQVLSGYYFFLGNSGSNNSVTVAAGGRMTYSSMDNPGNFDVGANPGANNNSISVTGANSVLSILVADFHLGTDSTGNQMTIADGGVVSNVAAYVGYGTNSVNNTVLVTGGGSLWNVVSNIFLGFGPGANNCQMTIAAGAQVQNAKGDIGYDGASNSVAISGANSRWNMSDMLVVGDHTAGNTLTIGGGAQVSNTLGYIGYAAGSDSNSVTVSGGSVWNSSGNLYVGNGGSGNQLTISSGAQVANVNGYVGVSGGNNSVLVTDSGSSWSNSGTLFVYGNNTLIVTNGATVSAGGQLTVPGTFVVTGTGSVLAAGGNIFRSSGSAQCTVADGAKLSAVNALLQASPATYLVTDPGTVWTNSGYLWLGYGAGGGAQLIISNGAAFYDTAATIGRSLGHDNNVTVTGPGSLWYNSGTVILGTNINASSASYGNTLTVTNGATAYIGGNAIIGMANASGNAITVAGGNLTVTNAGATGTLEARYGTLNLNGGTVTVDSLLATNGASSVVNFNGGTLRPGGSTVSNGVAFTVGDGTNAATLNLQGGTHNFADGLVIAANAQVRGAATIGGSVSNNGAINPGASIGTLTILSNYTQNVGGALNVELADIGSNDVLAVGGTAQLGGTLNVTNVNGFSPALSNAFTLLTAGTVSGTFSATNLPALDPAYDWSVAYSPTSVVLQMVNGASLYALWSQSHIPDPNQRESVQNPDNDTFNNWQEYVADTDPTNGASYFCVTNIPHASPVTVHFDSSAGRLYTMQGVPNLVNGAWTNVAGVGPRLGAGGADSMADTNDPPQGPFYRMEVELP
jgi:T5SS/PEP-CTERM-associated repeat protein